MPMASLFCPTGTIISDHFPDCGRCITDLSTYVGRIWTPHCIYGSTMTWVQTHDLITVTLVDHSVLNFISIRHHSPHRGSNGNLYKFVLSGPSGRSATSVQ